MEHLLVIRHKWIFLSRREVRNIGRQDTVFCRWAKRCLCKEVTFDKRPECSAALYPVGIQGHSRERKLVQCQSRSRCCLQ